MDEVVFIVVMCFCRKLFVMILFDCVDFKEVIFVGIFVEFILKVVYVGNISFKVDVEIFLERMYKDDKYLVIFGSFMFVVVDDNYRLILVVCEKMINGFD